MIKIKPYIVQIVADRDDLTNREAKAFFKDFLQSIDPYDPMSWEQDWLDMVGLEIDYLMECIY